MKYKKKLTWLRMRQREWDSLSFNQKEGMTRPGALKRGYTKKRR